MAQFPGDGLGAGETGQLLQRYRLLSQHARDIVLFVRPDGRIVEANAAAVVAYGYDHAGLLARTVFDLRDPATAHLVGEQIMQADSEGVTFETVHRRADGSTFPVEVSARGADVGGERLLLSIVRDITDRKRVEDALRDREERYRDLFENANDIIYTLDLQGRITSLNKRAEQALGLTLQECLGRSLATLAPPEYLPKMQAALDRKLAGESGATTYELEVVSRSGARVLLEVSSRLIVRGGRPVGVQGIARDITERRRLEEELRRRSEDLADRDRRKDEFLAMLGHELRNPLAPIRNGVAILGMLGGTSPEIAAVRDMIDRQATQLARLVDDLLDVSRITRGKVLLRKGRLDLAGLLRGVADDFRPTLDGVELGLDLPAGPVWVEGDPTRLAQAVGNLLHNAAKFTERGGRVSVRLSAGEGGAVLTVRDTGVGMSAQTLSGLFEPFNQADGSTDRTRGGLGLGLAVVKGLVELHGGSVEASSAGVGQGSEFTLRLPLGPAEGEVPAGAPPLPAGAPGLRIVVVEDNLDVAESLRMLLGMSGHDVAVAHTGAAGLEAARRHRPDVVVCDIGLPGGMDGYAVARALRREPQPPRVLIALTGYGQEEDRRRAHQAGFDLHLVKPVDPLALVRVLAGFAATR
jgi:PAS domain S-box-containing protein